MSAITAVSIANRALQRIGAARITSFTDNTRNANEAAACYDMLRRAELRRNAWTFSARRTALRPYQTASNIVSATPATAGITMAITFGTWAIGTTYKQSDVVIGSDGQTYISLQGSNTGNDPTVQPGSLPWWSLYFGPDVAQEYVTAWLSTITYGIGNNVIGSDGNAYQSVVSLNLNHNPVGDGGTHWVAGTALATKTAPAGYYAGEPVYAGGNLYISLVNGNTVDPTTNVDNVTGLTFANSWETMTTAATLSPLNFIYPIGSGPLSQASFRNVFRKPVNFLREMPQQPKAGSQSIMGAPSNLSYTDWEQDGNYIISSNQGPILYRFAADVQDPTIFDPLFAEGLSARMGFELCEILTQSVSKLEAIAQEYKTFMGSARSVNAIEQGPVEQPLDDLLQVRY